MGCEAEVIPDHRHNDKRQDTADLFLYRCISKNKYVSQKRPEK